MSEYTKTKLNLGQKRNSETRGGGVKSCWNILNSAKSKKKSKKGV